MSRSRVCNTFKVLEMNYDYNRKAFRSVCAASGIEPLATSYCACILLELSLKQHLNLVSTVSNSGHDLSALILRLGQAHRKHAATCNSLQSQLGYALRNLYSQGRNGVARTVPPNSYPHIRYLRHSSDWLSDCSSDVEVVALKSLLQRIITYFSYTIGVNV